MPILERMLEIIIPVFMIVSVGYFYARRYRPDMGVFNRIALEVCTPMLTYSALASRTFEIERYLPLLAGGALLIFGAGLLAWPLALPITLITVGGMSKWVDQEKTTLALSLEPPSTT